EPTVPQPPNHRPTVTVLAPNGGEFWGSGSTRPVEWKMTDLEDGILSVTADLSVDSGATFPYSMFAGPIGQGKKTHPWTLPMLATTTARIRICVSDSEGLNACDVSDADFTIDPSGLVITVDTGPSGFPVRVDGVNHTAPYVIACAPATTHSAEVAATQPINWFSRYGFVGWSDGGSRAHDIVCDANRTVTASYQWEWLLDLDTDPVGIDLLYDGVPVATPQQIWCAAGSTHALEGPSPSAGAPGVRYVFDRWTDTSVENPRTHTCDRGAIYKAVYHAEFLLTLDTSPTGLTVVVDGVSYTAPSSTWCPEFAIHTIEAPSPQSGYDFSSWSDGGNQSHPIMCLAPATITAYFTGPPPGIPSVIVTAPNGGEDWTGGSAHTVAWTTTDPDDATLTVNVSLSVDDGATYPFLLFSSTLPVGANSYDWTLPLVDTGTARIRVCALDGGGRSACDASDGPFGIDSTAPALALSSPVAGATDVDVNADILIVFSEKMNRSATEASFSVAPDPGPTPKGFAWSTTVVADDTLAVALNTLAYATVYTVTIGCTARDSSDPGNGVAPCPLFTFTTASAPVPPSVRVIVPAGGEVWTGGTMHTVSWSMSDLDTPGDLVVDIVYSLDGGSSWTSVVTGLGRPQGANVYPVTVPSVDGPILFRVCASDGASLACDVSPAATIDATAPAVASVTPIDGSRNVAPGAEIVVTFTEPMDTATLPPVVLTLSPAAGPLVASWSLGDRILTVSHAPYTPCTTYTVAVEAGVEDASDPGLGLLSRFAWSFTTACPPSATLLAPVGGEDWTGGTDRTVRFLVTDDVDAQVQVWVNVTVDAVEAPLFAGLVSVGETTVPWTLPPATGAATVTLVAADSLGTTAAASSGAFTIDTTAPALLSVSPADGASDVARNASVVLTFNEPMDRAATEAALAITPSPGGIALGWDASGRILTISFLGSLATDTAYEVSIGCGAGDDSDPGNRLAGCAAGVSSSFRTELGTPEAVEGGTTVWVTIALVAAAGSAAALAASEPGRVAIAGATAARLYARKPKGEKDSEIRGAILYYVRVHPGDCYMDIKRNLQLNDGVVTYHLARLEKDVLIKSAIRGARKRYYPAQVRVPLENGGELHEIQQRMLRLVAKEPGMPVALLAEQLGVSYQLALYHLRKLAGADHVGLERRGLRLRAFPESRER
ncbi:MAG TPA: Ig-like domain-containing protein, partial [Thermoplasmata archaeon]|nr:Ig-like domain-containing protein [Thermoplasmata archaeon]